MQVPISDCALLQNLERRQKREYNVNDAIFTTLSALVSPTCKQLQHYVDGFLADRCKQLLLIILFSSLSLSDCSRNHLMRSSSPTSQIYSSGLWRGLKGLSDLTWKGDYYILPTDKKKNKAISWSIGAMILPCELR